MLFGKSRPNQLLSFDEVQSALQSRSYHFKGVQAIPLDRVVGSEGRWRDFSRDFLPLPRHRQRMQQLASAGASVLKRPIQVFQVDQVYFIRDGHHRTALARERGETHIAALVTEIVVRAAITPELEQDAVLRQAQLSHFLEETDLDKHAPTGDFRLTNPALYATLLQHILAHRYYLGLDHCREFSMYEAASSWHDLVYLPVQEALQRSGALREFPKRTPAELYLWIAHHREEIRCSGEFQSDIEVASALVEQWSERTGMGLFKRLRRAFRAAWRAVHERPEPPLNRPARRHVP